MVRQRSADSKWCRCAEHWVVVRGTAEVTIDDQVVLRPKSDTANLPIDSVHRLASPGNIDLKMIEVQVGSFTDERRHRPLR